MYILYYSNSGRLFNEGYKEPVLNSPVYTEPLSKSAVEKISDGFVTIADGEKEPILVCKFITQPDIDLKINFTLSAKVGDVYVSLPYVFLPNFVGLYFSYSHSSEVYSCKINNFSSDESSLAVHINLKGLGDNENAMILRLMFGNFYSTDTEECNMGIIYTENNSEG